jgi:hypothetical protein
MVSAKNSDFYTEKDLEKIKTRWLQDKARIDANPTFGYYRDRDAEYERCLCNANLRKLFRHAA